MCGQSLSDIDPALKRIDERIREVDNNVNITESASRSQNEITKLVVRTRDRVHIGLPGNRIDMKIIEF